MSEGFDKFNFRKCIRAQSNQVEGNSWKKLQPNENQRMPNDG